MDFGTILLIVAVGGAILFFGNRGQKEAPSSSAPSRQNSTKRQKRDTVPSEFSRLRNRLVAIETPPDDGYVTEWVTYDFKTGKPFRPEGIVAMQGYNDIKLVGLGKTHHVAADFILEAIRNKLKVELTRQPDNPVDPNAIAAEGVNPVTNQRFQLGFIPAETANDMAKRLPKEMPISGELRKAGIKRDSDTVFITINVLGPNAAGRKKYESG